MTAVSSDVAFTPSVKAAQAARGNCPQHIPRKVNLADAAAMLTARDARIADLEAELALVQKPRIAVAVSGGGEWA